MFLPSGTIYAEINGKLVNVEMCDDTYEEFIEEAPELMKTWNASKLIYDNPEDSTHYEITKEELDEPLNAEEYANLYE